MTSTMKTILAINLALIAITSAMPMESAHQISVQREASRPGSQIHVTQTMFHPRGENPIYDSTLNITKCIQVREVDVPIVIDLVGVAHASRTFYRLLGYNTECLNTPQWELGSYTTATNFRAPVIINQRVPILSFRLSQPQPPRQYLGVAFVGRTETYTRYVASTSCQNLYDTSARYAYAVKIFRRHSNVSVRDVEVEIFTDENCSSIPKTLKHGGSILEFTQTHDLIRSIAIDII